MELLRFLLDNLLGPVFDHDLAMVRGATSDPGQGDSQEDGEAGSRVSRTSEASAAGSAKMKKRKKMRNQDNTSGSCMAGDAILDPSGPKLIEGFRNWLLFYQLIGHINWSRAPLYLALAYRLLVLLSTNYIILTHFIFKIVQTRVLDLSYKNPIFVLISFLTLLVGLFTNLAIFYTGTFNLCPMFKILATPRLCFVNRRTQRALGATTLKYMLVFFIYQTVLLNLLVYETFAAFINNFNLLDFLLEYYTVMVYSYSYVGLANLDFYVRSCFGAWLLALATNLECRQTRLDCMQQREEEEAEEGAEEDELGLGQLASREPADRAHSPSHATPPAALEQARRRRESIVSKFCDSYLFISLDEIQKSLNTMDDHLEVTRTIQTFSLLLIDLLAFFASGGMLLIAYNALAKANDVYHGSLFILLALNFAFLVTLTYLGDSFINYALSKLVQTVEDEYFLQETGPDERPPVDVGIRRRRLRRRRCSSAWEGNIKSESREQATDRVMATKDGLKSSIGLDAVPKQQVATRTTRAREHEAPAARRINWAEAANKQFLSIKRSDVLFCRELLEQFENHLATPWSKLTFKAHLNIMATFATLVAAQIIFDSH